MIWSEPCSHIAFRNKADEPGGVCEMIVPEVNGNAFAAGFQLFNACHSAMGFDVRNQEQMLYFFRQRAKTIDEFSRKTLDPPGPLPLISCDPG